jgi:hypothetical protein
MPANAGLEGSGTTLREPLSKYMFNCDVCAPFSINMAYTTAYAAPAGAVEITLELHHVSMAVGVLALKKPPALPAPQTSPFVVKEAFRKLSARSTGVPYVPHPVSLNIDILYLYVRPGVILTI